MLKKLCFIFCWFCSINLYADWDSSIFCELAAQTNGVCLTTNDFSINSTQKTLSELEKEVMSCRTNNILKSSIQSAIVSVSPYETARGKTVDIILEGVNTHFNNTSQITSTVGSISNLKILSATKLQFSLTVAATAPLGIYTLTVNTQTNDSTETVTSSCQYVTEQTSTSSILSIQPNTINLGATVEADIRGNNTHFSATDYLNLGSGITAKVITAQADYIKALITVQPTATTGYRQMTVVSNTETVKSLRNDFLLVHAPVAQAQLKQMSPDKIQMQHNTSRVITFTVKGENTHFSPTTTLNFGSGIQTQNINIISPIELQVTVIIDSKATGFKTLQVNIDNDKLTLNNGLEIIPPLPETYYALQLKTIGSGKGKIEGTKTGSYTENTKINLIAIADTNSEFLGWQEKECNASFYLTQDTICTAIFDVKKITNYQLTLKTTGEGAGLIEGAESKAYPKDTLITLSAIAENDSVFVEWTPTLCRNPFKLVENTSCTAHFSLKDTTNTSVSSPLPIVNPSPTLPVQLPSLAQPSTTLPTTIIDIQAPQLLVLDPIVFYLKIGKTSTIDLNNYFNQKGLNYTIQSSKLTKTVIEDNYLKLIPLEIGYEALELIASNAANLTIAAKIAIFVQDECEIVENFNGSCNMQAKVTAIKKNNGGIIEGVVITSILLENEGWIGNSINHGKIKGGILYSDIINLGVIEDVVFVGRLLEGGSLSGTILNNSQTNGIIKNVSLLENAIIHNGCIAGQIQGNPIYPAYLNNICFKENTYLSNVVLDNDTFNLNRIAIQDKKVVLGEGVRFSSEFPCAGNMIHIDKSGNFKQTSSSCIKQEENKIVFTIPEDRGQSAELFILMLDKQGQWYSFINSSWQKIEKNIAALKTSQHFDRLPFTVVNEVSFIPSNTSQLYAGYRLKNGEIIHSENLVKP